MTKTEPLSLPEQVRLAGAREAALVPVSSLCFSLEFRAMCEANACGMYGKCWMCPPYAGEAEALIAAARAYDTTLVYQTVHPLEDSFDIEGMLEAGERQNQLARKVRRLFQRQSDKRFLHLGAGGCRMCPRCAVLEHQPCRAPEEAVASLEAYCIDVSRLAQAAGMRYINGQNTVTYFGALLF